MDIKPGTQSIKILLMSRVLNSAKDLYTALSAKVGNKDLFKVYPCSDTSSLLSLVGQHPDASLIIVEEGLINAEFAPWVKRLSFVAKKADENISCPPILLMLEAERPPEVLREALHSGIREIGLKPYDMSLLLEKIHYLLKDKKLSFGPEVFRMPCMEEANVAEPKLLESISETQAVLLTNRELKPGEVLSLYSRAFLDGQKEVVAVCAFCVPSENEKYPYRATLHFQALSPAVTTGIRKWIRAQTLEKNTLSLKAHKN